MSAGRVTRTWSIVGATLLFSTLLPLLGPAGAAAPKCFGERATKVGTDGDNTINGTPGDDVIVGKDGDDEINGKGGADLICAGNGRDTMDGGPGADKENGGDGIDGCLDYKVARGCEADMKAKALDVTLEPIFGPEFGTIGAKIKNLGPSDVKKAELRATDWEPTSIGVFDPLPINCTGDPAHCPLPAMPKGQLFLPVQLVGVVCDTPNFTYEAEAFASGFRDHVPSNNTNTGHVIVAEHEDCENP